LQISQKMLKIECNIRKPYQDIALTLQENSQ
jgi:hypothetical protein